MRRTPALLALGALGSPAAAWLARVGAEESWHPPRETIANVDQDQVALGTSPRPTRGPELLARMELVPRMDEYTLGANTCGFVKSNGNSFTCINAGASCSFSDNNVGCCELNKPCNVIKTTCLDYDAVEAGSCNLPNDFHTLCCQSSRSGACFTWLISTTGVDDEPDKTFTLLDCATASGTATLLDYDPAWAETHIFGLSSTSRTTSTSSAPTPTETEDGGGGTNVGAIAGGVVGGVAALALIGVVAFLFWRRSKKNKQTPPAPAPVPVTDPQSPPTNMAQMDPTSPTQSYPPTSPSPLYPSGVPSNYQYQPQAYDPHMSYPQGGQYPPQQGFNTYSPQPGFQGQYPPQQGQYGYAAGGFAPNPTGSPPPQMSPSPGAKEGSAPPQEVSELPAQSPIGNENNRAELG